VYFWDIGVFPLWKWLSMTRGNKNGLIACIGIITVGGLALYSGLRFGNTATSTVIDTKVGLTWQGVAPRGNFTQREGELYCMNNTARLPGEGWRLPSVSELTSLLHDYPNMIQGSPWTYNSNWRGSSRQRVVEQVGPRDLGCVVRFTGTVECISIKSLSDVRCVRLSTSAEMGVPEDETRVEELFKFKQACASGDARGCVSLGNLYENGTGVTKDEARAAELFKQACDGGDARGCAILSRAYVFGQGVPVDSARAAELRKQACDGDESIACDRRLTEMLRWPEIERDH
jgi:hypothetical protein